MSIAVAEQTAQVLTGHQQILLDNIPWETYEALLDGIGERHIRLAYDNGFLEIRTLSFGHQSRCSSTNKWEDHYGRSR